MREVKIVNWLMGNMTLVQEGSIIFTRGVMRHIMKTSILWKVITVSHGRRGAIMKDKGGKGIMNVVQREDIMIIGKRGVIKVIREMASRCNNKQI